MINRDDPLGLEPLRQAASDSPLSDLQPLLGPDFIASLNHGDLPRWLATLDELPLLSPGSVDLKQQVRIGDQLDADSASRKMLYEKLQAFIPWRKGPFSLFGIDIDSEWQSNLKWDRLKPFISPLEGRKVLDVGCGNGYHCLRAAGEGAELVIGLEPYLVYVMQFLAVKHYLPDCACYLLPVRLEQYPGPFGLFDTVFSMGVLYHVKSPVDHLQQLKRCLRKKGELVLETLIVEGETGYSLTPQEHYARMSNVWFVPTTGTLTRWLERSGFVDIKVVDISTTGILEQRKTQWMPYKSLEDSLDPQNPGLTIEGLPAPRRAIITATTPG